MEEVRIVNVDLSLVDQVLLREIMWQKTKFMSLQRVGSIAMLAGPHGLRAPKLEHLDLHWTEFRDGTSYDLAKALVQIQRVCIKSTYPLSIQTLLWIMKRINNNNYKSNMKELHTERVLNFTNFNPFNLRTWISKMDYIRLMGSFTPNQLTAISSIPGIRIRGTSVVILERLSNN